MSNTFSEEFEGAAGLAPQTETVEGNTVSTETPAADTAAEKETYTLADGTQGSRAAFIREKFLNDNLSRKEISEQFGFPYRIVYGATVNLQNEADATSRGRSPQNASITVNAENQLVEVKTVDGVETTFVNGVAVDVVYAAEELVTKDRNQWIKEQVAAGVSRGDVAKILDLSYGVIYGITKEQDGTRATHEVELEDGTKISRSEYIRRLLASGKTRGEIAKELDVPYSVVWQATKTEKTDAEKYADAIAAIEVFGGKVEDKTAFDSALNVLKSLTIKVTEEDAKDATAAEAAENAGTTEA